MCVSKDIFKAAIIFTEAAIQDLHLVIFAYFLSEALEGFQTYVFQLPEEKYNSCFVDEFYQMDKYDDLK